MRGPSGVPLAKNVVSELALEAVVQGKLCLNTIDDLLNHGD